MYLSLTDACSLTFNKHQKFHDFGWFMLTNWWKWCWRLSAATLTSILQDLKRFLSPRQYFPPMVGLQRNTKKIKQPEYSMTTSNLHHITRQHLSFLWLCLCVTSLSVRLSCSCGVYTDQQTQHVWILKLRLRKKQQFVTVKWLLRLDFQQVLRDWRQSNCVQWCSEMKQENTVGFRFGSIHSQFNQFKMRHLAMGIQRTSHSVMI